VAEEGQRALGGRGTACAAAACRVLVGQGTCQSCTSAFKIKLKGHRGSCPCLPQAQAPPRAATAALHAAHATSLCLTLTLDPLSNPEPFFFFTACSLQADMLLRAHLERETDEVAPILRNDLKFVLSKAPILLEEMMKVGAAAGQGALCI
jgi:hypothetical protein